MNYNVETVISQSSFAWNAAGFIQKRAVWMYTLMLLIVESLGGGRTSDWIKLNKFMNHTSSDRNKSSLAFLFCFLLTVFLPGQWWQSTSISFGLHYLITHLPSFLHQSCNHFSSASDFLQAFSSAIMILCPIFTPLSQHPPKIGSEEPSPEEVTLRTFGKLISAKKDVNSLQAFATPWIGLLSLTTLVSSKNSTYYSSSSKYTSPEIDSPIQPPLSTRKLGND